MILITRRKQYFLSTYCMAGAMESYLNVLFVLILPKLYKITLLWAVLFYRQGKRPSGYSVLDYTDISRRPGFARQDSVMTMFTMGYSEAAHFSYI